MSKPLRILMVEDSDADAELAQHELKQHLPAFLVERVQDETSLKKALLVSRPDIVLADYNLPGFGGLEALRTTRAEYRDVPFICISDTIGEENAVDLIQRGATDFVSKKNIGRLNGAIQRALREVNQVRERLRAETSLRDSEARFRALFEAAGAGIAVEDLKGRILETNRALQQMLGYSGEEFLQITRQDFTHTRDHKEDQAHFSRLLAGESEHYQVEKRFVRKDGRIIWGRLTVSVVRSADNRAQFSLAMIEDITERLRAEEAYMRNASIVEFSNDAIISQTFDGVIFSWNPAAEQVYGYTASEANGRAISIIIPAEREAKFTEVLERIKKGESIDNFESKWLRKDGREIDVSVTASPIKDASGRITGVSSISRDITKSKLAEAALRESEGNYRRLVELAPDGILIQCDGKFVYLNSAAVDIFGARTPAQLLGKIVLDVVHPDFQALFERNLKELEAGKEVPLHEHKLIRVDGQLVDVEMTAIPFVYQGQAAAQVMIRDITERKHAEEALRKSEAGLAASQKIAHLGSWEWDLVSNKLEWSDETYRIFGLSRETACSMEQFFKCVHPEDASLVREAIDRTLNSGASFNVDHRIVLLNGETKTLNEQAELICDEKNRPIRLSGTVLDITQRKRAENLSAAFSKLGERLSSATTAVLAARIIVEVADRLLGWDSCGIDLCSQDRKTITSILGMDVINGKRTDVPLSYRNVAPSYALKRVLEHGAQLILRLPPYEKSVDFVAFGDRARPSASLMYVPVRNGGQIIGVLSIQSYSPNAYSQRDLETLQALGDHCGGALERIRAESDRQKLENQLRQSQKMESVGQLAGGIAHDFNNILTVIQGHVSLLGMGSSLSAEARESAEQINQAAQRAANLTRQLLTFSRRQVMQPKNLDLNEVVNNMTKMLRRLLGEDVTLQVSYAATLPVVHADPGMLEQIILNLSVNARDAMPKGGKLFINTSVVTYDAAQAQQTPEASAGKYVCLTVRDTGTGIPPEILPHIFEPFFTTKDVGKGTGLGLATVYGIVQQHHGWIKATSVVGKETMFQIFLPAQPEKSGAVAAADAPAAEPDLRGGQETILVVEDEPPLRMLVRSMLGRYGYRVLEAASGVEAISVWEKHKQEIQLLLTDMVMPNGMSGRELAQKLLTEQPALKVIYSSGYSLAVVGADMVLHEGINFLQKPYVPRKLMLAIRDCLDT